METGLRLSEPNQKSHHACSEILCQHAALSSLAYMYAITTYILVVSTPTHPRIIELEGKMKNGIRLSVEESSELGQLNSAATAVNTNPASPLLVKRDSCPIVPETISAPC
ncbi:MAG: hypothetical protein BYD32DRAFT_460227 [Podila humilis]|nr:MAG: hypothetical protein BYD32DRAFT_460227 [Podila humilis]